MNERIKSEQVLQNEQSKSNSIGNNVVNSNPNDDDSGGSREKNQLK